MSEDTETAAVLTDALGLGSVTGPAVYVTRGAMGEIWRVDTTEGSWAVKWLFEWAPTERRPPDIAVQVAAIAAGLRVARPVLSSDGAAVVKIGQRHARVYEWVDLAPPITAPAAADRAAEAGRILGVIHRLEVPAEGPIDAWYLSAPDPEIWRQLVDRGRSRGLGWARSLADKLPLIGDLTRHVQARPNRTARVCHRDFTPDNVRPDAVTAEFVVLDWENAGPLVAEYELGHALLSWTAPGATNDGAPFVFLSAYAEASGRVPELATDLFTTAVATTLNFLETMAERALADAQHGSFAETQVARLLGTELVNLNDGISAASVLLGLT